MTKPPFKYVPNPESVRKTAFIVHKATSALSPQHLVNAIIAAYMEAEHAAGRAKEAAAVTSGTFGSQWFANSQGDPRSAPKGRTFPVLILRLPEGEK